MSMCIARRPRWWAVEWTAWVNVSVLFSDWPLKLTLEVSGSFRCSIVHQTATIIAFKIQTIETWFCYFYRCIGVWHGMQKLAAVDFFSVPFTPRKIARKKSKNLRACAHGNICASVFWLQVQRYLLSAAKISKCNMCEMQKLFLRWFYENLPNLRENA